MKKSMMCLFIIILFFVFKIQLVSAHGVIYETKAITENKLRVTLKWSSSAEAKKGISPSFYYTKNAKTVTIGYTLKDKAPKSVNMDIDMSAMVQPVRIILARENDTDNLPFPDIKNIEAEEYIRHLHDAGVIDGDTKGRFNPENKLSRAEFAVIMVKALKLSGTAPNSKKLKDIDKHWAKQYILLAVQKGILSGYTDGTFRPNKEVTVAEVSAVLTKAYKFKTVKNGAYSKIKQDKWYTSFIKKMFEVGILEPKDSIYKSFDEEKAISRANCAMMVSRALSTY